MRNKKLTAAVAVATVTAVMLAGCGKQEPDASSEVSSAAVESSSVAEEAVQRDFEEQTDGLD